VVYVACLVFFRQSISLAFLPHAGAAEVAMLSTCLLLLAVGQFADWTNCTLSGALQGAGKQRLGACIYGFSMWTLAPVSFYFFAFQCGWGVTGIWAGMALVFNVQVVIMLVCTILEIIFAQLMSHHY
jgi:MATE family multidrug resistance protein